MIYLRSLIFNILFPVTVLFFSLVCLICGLVAGRSGIVRAGRWNGITINVLLRYLCKITVSVQGREHIPKAGPYIVACKHQSAWETMYIHNIVPDPIVIMKKELLYVPIFGVVVKIAGSILIDRGKGKGTLPQLIEGAEKNFKLGRSIFIFPEGTRSIPGVAGNYRHGVTALYEKFQVPVMPIALNSGVFWPRRGFLKYPGTIKLQILPPIAPGLASNDFKKKMVSEIETASLALASQ